MNKKLDKTIEDTRPPSPPPKDYTITTGVGSLQTYLNGNKQHAIDLLDFRLKM